jgi:hypothetical protein
MAVPAITSIAPTGGSVDGGTTVTITGTNLGTPTGVSFGSTAAASFAGVSATQAFAVAPAGTGTVHVKLTTAGGTSPETAADQFTYGAVLFTVAEARAFDKAQLTNATTYPDAAVIAKEAELREWFGRIFGVDFLPTTHTDEYHSGDGSSELVLDWPLVTSVSAASTRASTSWTALTAGELADIYVDPYCTDHIFREGGYWPLGRSNVKVTYVSGHVAVPTRIKRAALQLCLAELVPSNMPVDADGYDIGGTSVSFGRGDGWRDNWLRNPDGQAAYNAYSMKIPGIA